MLAWQLETAQEQVAKGAEESASKEEELGRLKVLLKSEHDRASKADAKVKELEAALAAEIQRRIDTAMTAPPGLDF